VARDVMKGRGKRSQYNHFYRRGWCILCERVIAKNNRPTHEAGKLHAKRYAHYTSHYDTAVRRLQMYLLVLICRSYGLEELIVRLVSPFLFD
jgi:hypothetical protein